jgi:hypothetical protein
MSLLVGLYAFVIVSEPQQSVRRDRRDFSFSQAFCLEIFVFECAYASRECCPRVLFAYSYLAPFAALPFIDLAPLHFQRLRLRLLGVFGSFCFSLGNRFLIPSDLAQYESPLLVPGLTRGPPSAAFPACPYETFLPLAVTLTLALPFLGLAIKKAGADYQSSSRRPRGN